MSSRLKKSSLEPIFLKTASSLKIGIAVSESHPEVTEELFEGAVNTLITNGIRRENIIRKNVPGSFELPLAAQILLKKNKTSAVICLGCVIKGETDHYNYICSAVSKGIMDVSLSHNKPVAFGVLTTDTLDQAINRAARMNPLGIGKLSNKGEEAALSVLKMLAK